MSNVAVNPKRYQKSSVFYQDLFDHCFSVNFRDKQRREFKNFSQGSMTVKDYGTQLKMIAGRVPDIASNPMTIRLQYWDGALPYIRTKWIENGFTAETTPINTLEIAAELYEQAHNLNQIESEKESGRSFSRYRNRNPQKWQNEQSSNDDESEDDPDSNSEQSYDEYPEHRQDEFNGQGMRDSNSRGKHRQNTNRKSQEEIAALRAEGRCFECEKPGHRAKDCRSRNPKAEPELNSNAISFDELEKLVSVRDNLPAMAMSFVSLDDRTESEAEISTAGNGWLEQLTWETNYSSFRSTDNKGSLAHLEVAVRELGIQEFGANVPVRTDIPRLDPKGLSSDIPGSLVKLGSNTRSKYVKSGVQRDCTSPWFTLSTLAESGQGVDVKPSGGTKWDEHHQACSSVKKEGTLRSKEAMKPGKVANKPEARLKAIRAIPKSPSWLAKIPERHTTSSELFNGIMIGKMAIKKPDRLKESPAEVDVLPAPVPVLEGALEVALSGDGANDAHSMLFTKIRLALRAGRASVRIRDSPSLIPTFLLPI